MSLNTIKDHYRESLLFTNRTMAAIVIVVVMFLILIGRLFYLQVMQKELFTTLSFNNQFRILPITPTRGLIFDRNGIILADNIPAYSLEIVPERTKDLIHTIEELQQIVEITPNEQKTFLKQLAHKKKSDSIPIKLKLTEEEVAKFWAHKHRFSAIEVVARLIRYYPEKELLAHVLGYIGPINEKEAQVLASNDAYKGTYYIGKSGVEKYYETKLHGVAGSRHVETDAHGRMIRVLNSIPQKSGTDLHLSLDLKLQKAAYEALGDLKGVIVALDPRNGEILALVSKPSFDPNLFVKGIDSKNYSALQNDINKPLYNRAIRGLYPPGSTIKPLVGLQGLEQGTITPGYRIFDPGFYRLNGEGRMYRDWNWKQKHGHGWTDLNKALAESCDTFFFTIAHKMGIDSLEHVYKQFGLGEITGVDIAGEIKGLVPSQEWKRVTRKEAWYPGETLNVGIGQGAMLTTPLQIAQMAAFIANKGFAYTPHVVKTPYEITEPKKVVIKNPYHWELIIKGMRDVVHAPGGTAHKISNGLSYTIAGKTGTAQVFNLKQNEIYNANKVKEHLRDHSWFVGFAPIENPEIAFAILIENKFHISGVDITRVFLDNYFSSKNKDLVNEQVTEN